MPIQYVDMVRRNHALEHATIALLRRHVAPETRISGRSTAAGFHLYADIPTELVERSSHEALALLKQGEGRLAISDQCGTNLAIGSILTGMSALVAVGRGRRLDRLPHALLAAMMAALVSPSLGRWVQKWVTTDARVQALEIVSVERRQRGPLITHMVKTTSRRENVL